MAIGKEEKPKTWIDIVFGKFLIDTAFTIKVILIALILLGLFFFPDNFYKFILRLLPIVGLILLTLLAFKLWVHYVQQKFISGITWVLLEIVPPREVLRSPQAMELFFSNALYHWSVKGWSEEWWQGAVWFWYSLEIASIDGQVHFYIRTPSRIRSLIETQMYAQYPQAQIKEVEDYTMSIDEKITENGIWDLWGCEFKLKEHDAYPINTYINFGLDKNPKEEQKVDPISSVIELFGSLKKGEQMWSQIVIRPSKQEYPIHHRHWWQEGHDWKEESDQELKRLVSPFTATRVDEDKKRFTEIRLPDYLKPVMTGLSNKQAKLGFDAGIRVAYVAKKEVYNMTNRKALRLIWRQYANPDSNSLERIHSTQPDQYPWSQVFMTPNKVRILKNRLLHAYREREFFYSSLRHQLFCHQPYMLPWPISPILFPNYFHFQTFLLGVEELATLWHFPGQILKVPTLERIESKESAPPTNLPS